MRRSSPGLLSLAVGFSLLVAGGLAACGSSSGRAHGTGGAGGGTGGSGGQRADAGTGGSGGAPSPDAGADRGAEVTDGHTGVEDLGLKDAGVEAFGGSTTGGANGEVGGAGGAGGATGLGGATTSDGRVEHGDGPADAATENLDAAGGDGAGDGAANPDGAGSANDGGAASSDGPGGADSGTGASFLPCTAMGLAQIRSIAYLPDSSAVAAGLAGAVAKLIDPSDGHEVRSFIGHAGAVNAVAVSADGATLMTASDDRTVKQWRVADGTLLASLPAGGRELLALAVSPDGSHVAAGAADGEVFLWQGGTLIATTLDHVDEVRGIGFTANGGRVFTASKDGSVRVWSGTDLSPIATPLQGGTWMTALAVSSDGAQVAVGDVEGNLRLWRASDANLVRQLKAPYAINSIAYAPDGTHIYVTTDDDLTSYPVDGSAAKLLVAPIGGSLLVAASPDGRQVFTATAWALWLNNPAGTSLRDPVQQGPVARTVGFLPDGSHLVIGGDFGLVVRSVPDGAVAQAPAWDQFAPAINDVALSASGGWLATAEESGLVNLWSTSTWSVAKPITTALVRANRVSFSPDGTLLAAGADQGADEIYAVPSGNPVTGMGIGGNVDSVAFSLDGTLLAAGSDNRELDVLSTADWSTTRRITDAHSPAVVDVSISSDSRLVASAGDQRVTVWQSTGTTARRDLFQGSSSFTSRTTAFSPDGSLLVAGGSDGLVRLWSVPGLTALPSLPAHGQGIVRARFARDGSRLAVAYDDGTVWLWCKP